MPSTIAVIGSGVIGRTLATRFAQAGHEVSFGARNPGDEQLQQFAAGIGVGVDAIPAAVQPADAVVIAIGGAAMPEAVPDWGPLLDGKTVVDATNAVGSASLNSLGLLALHAPGARLFRAFNSLGWENFADSRYGDLDGDLLFSGPDGDGRETVEQLIAATGLRPVWVGDNDKVQLVDNFVALWFTLAFERGYGRQTGFKILTR